VLCLGVKHVVGTPFPGVSLEFFSPENMAAVSDEQGEAFHQDKSRMGKGKKIQRQMEPKNSG
jgi:hypothetical protein